MHAEHTKKKYYYRIFGLTAESDVRLHCFSETEITEYTDFSICNAPVGEYDPLVTQINLNMFVSDEAVYFKLPETADFMIKGNKKIIIDPADPILSKKLISFLVNYVIPIFLSQSFLVFSGSTIRIGNKVIALCGHSGSGTSSLAYAALQNNAELISDEFSVFETHDKINALHGASGMWLWKDTLDLFNMNIQGYEPIRESIEKYFIPAPVTSAANNENQLDTLYYMSINKLGDLKIRELESSEKIRYLRDAIYNIRLSELRFGKTSVFKSLMKICHNCSVYLIERPEYGFFADDIFNKICKNNGNSY